MEWRGPDGRLHVPAPTVSLSEMKNEILVFSKGSPWRIYFRMMMVVFPAFFLLYTVLMIVIGLIEWDPITVISASLVSMPPILIALRITRPPIIQLWNLTPADGGSTLHNRGPLPALTTPIPTRMERHLLRDGTPLEFPVSKWPWAIFAICVVIGTLLSLWISTSGGSLIPILAFGVFAIPLWIVGFSIPVLAWWSFACSRLRIPARRVEAEAWLAAGMISAFPAFILNSLAVPELIPKYWSDEEAFFTMVAIGAPIIEETFKATVLLFFIGSMKSKRSGFLVGFSIGLGFALIENLQYIAVSLFGGPAELAVTTLVRGIGSIPAHALWTGIVGSAVGGFLRGSEINQIAEESSISTQIKIINVVESMGIDIDGDGTSGGFKQNRKLLKGYDPKEEWFISGSRVLETIDQASGQSSQRGVRASFLIAVAGHCTWNGLSVGVINLSKEMGLNEAASLFISLATISVMVATVVLLTVRELRTHSPRQ